MATLAQKRALMAKIRKAGKRPTPWIVHDGRTNGFNPANLQTLSDAISEVRLLATSPEPNIPRRTPPSRINIESYYENLAEAIDGCPHELKQILTQEINPENVLVMSAFKKFVAAVKLSEQVDFSGIHSRLRSTRESNEAREREYIERLENYHHQVKVREQRTEETSNKAQSVWASVLIGVVEQVQRNNDLNSLGRWDQSLIEALAERGPGFAKITRGKVTISFNLCKKMAPEHVEETLRVASDKQKAREAKDYEDFLWKGSIDEIERYLWDLLAQDPNDGEVAMIQGVLAERRGMVLVKSPYGGFRYVDPDELEDDLGQDDEIWGGRGFFDPRDKVVLDIYHQARKRNKQKI